MPIRHLGTLIFEWDEDKDRSNSAKHGVSFEEALAVFRDPLGGTVYDRNHSAGEDRFITIGADRRRRILVVIYTDRGDRSRIRSAGPATRAERRLDEKDDE